MKHFYRFPWYPIMDVYLIRKELLGFVRRTSSQLKGEVLDIGCGRMPYKDIILENKSVKNYIGMDIPNEIYNDKTFMPDIIWDGHKMPFGDRSVDSAIIIEVLEHCPNPEIIIQEAARVMKNEGILIFSVPFLYCLHDAPYDYYRYTPFQIKKMFEENGFREVEIEGYGGWSGSLYQIFTMALKKGKLNKYISFIFYLILLPFLVLLISTRTKSTSFKNGDSHIGYYGVAFK